MTSVPRPWNWQASSIAAFALLWSSLSEWATPETRAVCRAGRAAAAAAGTDAASTENDNGIAVGVSPQPARTTPVPPHGVPANLQARKAGAVAEAAVSQVRRQSRHGVVGSAVGTGSTGGGGGGGGGPTVTGALRHSGVSAMVNMHLAQAERALRAPTDAASGSTAGFQKWLWSDTADEARPGARPGGWVEEGTPRAGNETGLEAPSTGKIGSDSAEAAKSGGAATKYGGKGQGLVAEPGGGAEGRRAVAAVIDTLDAGRASAAANLSIAQWKVIPLVLLTALGLGGGAGGASGGSSKVVGQEEAEAGAGACARLCGPEAILTAREFEMLVEVLLEEE